MDSETTPISDSIHEGKDVYDMDIDRMINEGLGGGQVTVHNGLITESTTDSMEADNP
ncbi:hypothetical protein [Cohnella silvisoli]|uniref:DUF4025 domain-containing protein n=1 Tax=Cohnella silvisoli TaxID=2873699 RepID=A0ABV1KVW6_9BACL|nr:hypothetical protein [Cohnella silvisoli]MCD9023636.1 hypothetical protein [Cohnella silvisoli]